MGQYNAAVITTAGESIIAQALQGTSLTWTAMRASSTAIPSGTNLKALTSISGVQQTAEITSATVYNDTTVQVLARFANTGINAPYYIRTVGIYGTPQGGSETLIAVMTAVTPDEVPAYDADSPAAFIFAVQLTVQSAASVTMQVNDSGTATVAEMLGKVDAAGGNISDTKAVTISNVTTAYPAISANTTMAVILGRIKKFLADLKANCLAGLSVGDVFFQAKCYHKFEEFKKQGKTILFVSHDLSSISKYCDRAVLLNQGVLLGEGTPKKMIDIYKQVLVGQYPLPKGEGENLLDDEEIRNAAAKASDKADAKVEASDDKQGKAYKSGIQTAEGGENAANSAAENPDLLEYGDGAATITEYYVTDEKGTRTNSIIKGSEFTVHMRVKFGRDVAAPIFAFTFKNIMGIEITGTNSMVEKAFLDPVKAGDEKDISFTQKMTLQGGEYLLSFGVTGFEQNDFTVYHRLYDALNVTVVSDKNTVGYYDMNTKCTVTDVK